MFYCLWLTVLFSWYCLYQWILKCCKVWLTCPLKLFHQQQHLLAVAVHLDGGNVIYSHLLKKYTWRETSVVFVLLWDANCWHWLNWLTHSVHYQRTKQRQASVLMVFSALTLLAGRQEEHLACKKWMMMCWCGHLSGARCRLFAYATTSQNSIISLLHLNPGMVLPFWFQLTQLSWKKAVKQV